MKRELQFIIVLAVGIIIVAAADRFLFSSTYDLRVVTTQYVTAFKINRRTGQVWAMEGKVWRPILDTEEPFNKR